MKVDIDELNPVQRKVRVELPSDRVAGEFSRVYNSLGKRVRVKGFRTGKIPRRVLQGIYGDEVKGEVRSHLVEEALEEIIRERGLQIVSRPEVEADELSESQGFTFSAVFEVKPEISVANYIGIEVEKPKLAVTDSQVKSALDRLQESHARLEPISDREIVEKGDFVTLDFEGTIDGKPFAGSKGENYSLEVGGGHALPQFEEAVVGLALHEPRAVEVRYPEDYPNQEIAGKAVKFSLIARDIKQKVLPALDDEFAKDYGECASLDELRERLRGRLAEELNRYQQEDLKEKVMGRLIEAHPFVVPSSMVERQTRYLLERYQREMAPQNRAPEPLEEAKKNLEPRATRQVQATLLVERVAQLESIHATDKEIQDRIDALARAASEKGKALREYYGRAEAREELRAQMVFDRTVDFLLARARIKEVELPASKVDEQGEKS